MPAIVSRFVEVCVFRFAHDRPEYLLLQRAEDESLYPGIWQMVTGSIDGDEKAFVAALREMKEETALVPELFWVVPFTNVFYDRMNDVVHVNPVFAAQVRSDALTKLSLEHQRYEWLRCDEARAHLVWPAQRQVLDIVHRYIAGSEEAARLTRIPLGC